MQDENWSASRIWSSFDCHEAVSTHILHAAHDSSIMKENEHRSTKRSSKNTSFRRSFFRWQDSDRWQSSWDHSCITRSHWEVYFLNKVVKLSTRLLKSDLLESRDEIAMTTNYMKNAEYSRSMKRLFEIQWSQNKIIKEAKRSHFRLQMHELSNELKLIWRFAKWVRIESQLLKKLSQFSSLKSDDFDHIVNSFEEKTKILRKKFFSSSSQTDISDISKSFISLTVSFNSALSQDEMRQMIQRVKVDKASDAFEISNKALSTSLTELTSILISLFNACVTHKYHLKQFKKAQTIVLRKSKKSNYIDLKTYRLIALLNIMSKTLKSIMIKRLNDITETHHMLSNAQMRARCKQFVISALDLLVDQVHAVWDCEIRYMIFMLSLDITETFDHV